jgi:hypothetical protein
MCLKQKLDKNSLLDGTIEYSVGSILHNPKGPAIVSGKYKEWWFYGLKHRENGPAIEYEDGSQEWWFYGLRHRKGKPAVIFKEEGFNISTLTEEWWFYGKLHREDGPAVMKSDGTQEWWLYGKRTK